MNKINSVMILAVLLGLSLGCIGPGADADKCTGTVTAGSDQFTGRAETEEQVRLNACNKFCLETDPEFDAMYRIWLDSPAGREFSQKMKGQPTKQEAIFEEKRLLDYVTKNCAPRCVRDANKGKHTLQTKCR